MQRVQHRVNRQARKLFRLLSSFPGRGDNRPAGSAACAAAATHSAATHFVAVDKVHAQLQGMLLPASILRGISVLREILRKRESREVEGACSGSGWTLACAKMTERRSDDGGRGEISEPCIHRTGLNDSVGIDRIEALLVWDSRR